MFDLPPNRYLVAGSLDQFCYFIGKYGVSIYSYSPNIEWLESYVPRTIDPFGDYTPRVAVGKSDSTLTYPAAGYYFVWTSESNDLKSAAKYKLEPISLKGLTKKCPRLDGLLSKLGKGERSKLEKSYGDTPNLLIRILEGDCKEEEEDYESQMVGWLKSLNQPDAPIVWGNITRGDIQKFFLVRETGTPVIKSFLVGRTYLNSSGRYPKGYCPKLWVYLKPWLDKYRYSAYPHIWLSEFALWVRMASTVYASPRNKGFSVTKKKGWTYYNFEPSSKAVEKFELLMER